ncbi:pyridoxamine 5'-phosphate oxidase [Blastococcus sp. Marseille-P5729]|uniref:pyridoxamine 5'-phosphate oxidase n=1 Tax=Blastococcus sp. Marseille-P5729 TaxID=2086582 RepID=UPI000D0F1C3E|nr:pyridoxamine 5'-phosphate oxidase [Blastococcus sp. Marseille-P5729]
MSDRQFDVRRDRIRYELARLDDDQLADDPLDIFASWLEGAAAAGVREPNAMVLATAGADGAPRARTVLMRGYSDGFEFFTNYESTKGRQLDENPRASACFAWLPIHRQVIVEGLVERLPSEASDAYFASRPAESQIASATSPQSQVIDGIDGLLRRVEELTAANPDGVPRPEHWGGYRLMPQVIEFWQGNVGRVHDRFRFRRDGEQWVRERLAP